MIQSFTACQFRSDCEVRTHQFDLALLHHPVSSSVSLSLLIWLKEQLSQIVRLGQRASEAIWPFSSLFLSASLSAFLFSCPPLLCPLITYSQIRLKVPRFWPTNNWATMSYPTLSGDQHSLQPPSSFMPAVDRTFLSRTLWKIECSFGQSVGGRR